MSLLGNDKMFISKYKNNFELYLCVSTFDIVKSVQFHLFVEGKKWVLCCWASFRDLKEENNK